MMTTPDCHTVTAQDATDWRHSTFNFQKEKHHESKYQNTETPFLKISVLLLLLTMISKYKYKYCEHADETANSLKLTFSDTEYKIS